MNPLRHLGRLHRRVLIHRRPLAAVTAASAVLVALHAAAPPPPPTTVVLTASRDLPGGTVLGGDDVSHSRLPPDAAPDGALTDPGDVVGRTLAAPMTRGEVLTGRRTLTGGLLRGYPGASAVPVRVTDGAVVDLLRVGDEVSLVVADPDGRGTAETLAEDVSVLAVPRAGADSFTAGTPGRLVVVAVPRSIATQVAARAATGLLVVVWNR